MDCEKDPMRHADSGADAMNAPQYACLPHLLQGQAAHTPNALAILAPGRAPLTYGRLHRHMHDVVRVLRALGLGRNDRIALVLPNGPEMAVAFLSVAAGATCAPLNPAYSADEFATHLTALQAKALIVRTGMDSPARDVARARGLRTIELSPMLEAEAGLFTLAADGKAHVVLQGLAQPKDVALLLHTAGTTSRPKIVPLTHANLCTSAHNMRLALALLATDRCLNVLPMFHMHGLMGPVLTSLVAGASVVCTPHFAAPQFFTWLAEFRPTWYTAVPTIHQAILAGAAPHHEVIARCPLRFIRSGSAVLPPKVLAELERVFRSPVVEIYGMTETSGHVTCHPLPGRARKVGSVGLAAGPELAILDEVGNLLPPGEIGEVAVRGATVMQGYDNDRMANGHAFTRGWFRTGDLGYSDVDGYLFITGRMKELINRGGEKIAPQEVDEVLMEHPAVAHAVTFAVPHARLGEDAIAAVVLRPNALATADDIRRFAARRLAAFKVPQRVLLVDDIPKAPTGKLPRLGLEVSFQSFFETPSIAGMARRIEAARQAMPILQAPPLQPMPRDAPLPLSYAQQRLWFLEQLEPGGAAYNLCIALCLIGVLDVTALEESLAEMLRRHEILRTIFPAQDGRPIQAIVPAIPVALPGEDLRALPEASREAEVRRRATTESQQAFDLAHAPLWRAKLLRLADEEHVLLLNMHHIIFDGWSFDVLFRELTALYSAFSAGEPSPRYQLFLSNTATLHSGSVRGSKELCWRHS
jgi:acyl-CoA synthetase (AMP-forming)/AMP-acid ligase II